MHAPVSAQVVHGGSLRALARARSGPPFPNVGISLEGLEFFLDIFGPEITTETTTSDVCHTIIKMQTVPRGWACVPELINAEKRWFSHQYINVLAPGEPSEHAPPGTQSFLQKMKADPEMAGFVGVPTVFLSHAWSYKFRNVIAAIRNYVSGLPEGSPMPFFWFDCFSIDEHAAQAFT